LFFTFSKIIWSPSFTYPHPGLRATLADVVLAAKPYFRYHKKIKSIFEKIYKEQTSLIIFSQRTCDLVSEFLETDRVIFRIWQHLPHGKSLLGRKFLPPRYIAFLFFWVSPKKWSPAYTIMIGVNCSKKYNFSFLCRPHTVVFCLENLHESLSMYYVHVWTI
jgi:hypothetical protein